MEVNSPIEVNSSATKKSKRSVTRPGGIGSRFHYHFASTEIAISNNKISGGGIPFSNVNQANISDRSNIVALGDNGSVVDFGVFID